MSITSSSSVPTASSNESSALSAKDGTIVRVEINGHCTVLVDVPAEPAAEELIRRIAGKGTAEYVRLLREPKWNEFILPSLSKFIHMLHSITYAGSWDYTFVGTVSIGSLMLELIDRRSKVFAKIHFGKTRLEARRKLAQLESIWAVVQGGGISMRFSSV